MPVMRDILAKTYIFATQLIAVGFIVTNFFTSEFEATLFTYIRVVLLSLASFYFFFWPDRTEFLGKGNASKNASITISKIVAFTASTVNIILAIAFYFHL
jgi:hypothetical protein